MGSLAMTPVALRPRPGWGGEIVSSRGRPRVASIGPRNESPPGDVLRQASADAGMCANPGTNSRTGIRLRGGGGSPPRNMASGTSTCRRRLALHGAPDLVPNAVLGYPQVVNLLQVEPVLRRRAHPLCQSQRGVHRDGALAAKDFRDPVLGNVKGAGEVCASHISLIKFFAQKLARVERVARHRVCPLVVVDNLNVEGFGFSVGPLEADTILVVDTNAVLPGAITLEGFQPVSSLRAQVFKGRGRLQCDQASSCLPCDTRQRAYMLPSRQSFGAAITILWRHSCSSTEPDYTPSGRRNTSRGVPGVSIVEANS